MRRLLFYCSLLFVVILLFSCSKETKEEIEKPSDELTAQQKEGKELAESLWATSPLQEQPLDENRTLTFERIQEYADKCTSDYFESYLKSIDLTSESQEKYDVLLYYYRYAFDRILNDIKNENVEDGTAHIWMLYNMGYVVKTPSCCFAIDIMHRWAEKLAPYLDFLCLTHNHQDHYDTKLIEAMLAEGKPVISNFIEEGKEYYSKNPSNYKIGKVSVRTSITDHNNSGLSNFVTVYSIDCGNDSGNLTIMHTGDSNYKPSQFTNILNRVNILIPRYAPNELTENNIIGEGNGKVIPDYVLLSHILELTHVDTEASRWSLPMALERASKINCAQTYVPMWGEKLIWKDNKLNQGIWEE